MVLISVIIPVYNGEKYIRKAIESALNQTYKGDYEIVVMDDRSSDNSYEIAREYEKINSKVKTARHTANEGTSSALNTCIALADGDWIKWLSADDEMLPNCLDTLMNNVHDHMTIYYTNYHIIDRNGKRIGDWKEIPARPANELWAKFFGNGSSSIIHRDVFDRCGLFDESLRYSEDYEFWLRATMLYGVSLTLIPEFTINYRQHPEQLTNKVSWKGHDQRIKDRIKSQIIVR